MRVPSNDSDPPTGGEAGAVHAAAGGTAPIAPAPLDPAPLDRTLIEETLEALRAGRPVRRALAGGGRLHVDRSLPFVCVHRIVDGPLAAREIVAAGASHLLVPDLAEAVPLLNALARDVTGAADADAGIDASATGFIVVEIGELEQDRLRDDAPWLPPFELELAASAEPAAARAAEVFVETVTALEVRYRTPRVDPPATVSAPSGFDDGVAYLRVRFAPIYRAADGETLYPELLERLVARAVDALLRALAAFVEASGGTPPATHRALGRRTFVDAVREVDRRIDAVARRFEPLSALTPINARDAFERFRAGGFARAPRLLYRPLAVDPSALKHELHGIRLDALEDPVLLELYGEKRQELDLQITLLTLRDAPAFLAASRLYYGEVEPALLAAARETLERTASLEQGGPPARFGSRKGSATARVGADDRSADDVELVDCEEIARAARAMIATYASRHEGFRASVEIRDDMPAGMMVSGSRLHVSRHTRMPRRRLGALLHHEIGVHLLTFVNGDAQGLALFRSGLAGYEGAQEGLAVLAEHLVGGLDRARMRLVAARVVGCAAMLDGASFVDVFRLARDGHGFAPERAFQLALRLFRSGGLAKDAIYLRGLLEVLAHLRAGGSLAPFWMGKIAARHLPRMEELAARGLLRAAAVTPLFLEHPEAAARLAAARAGVAPVDLIR